MATALGARLGFRPALAGPGRSSGFSGACKLCHAARLAAGGCLLLHACNSRSAHARAPHTLPTTCAVCPTFRKPAPRRLAAAEPAAPAPPAPSLPPNQQGTAPQAAPAAKKKWWDFDLALWQVKLVALGVTLFAAASSFQLGQPTSGGLRLFWAFVILVTPWFDLECVGWWAACADGGGGGGARGGSARGGAGGQGGAGGRRAGAGAPAPPPPPPAGADGGWAACEMLGGQRVRMADSQRASAAATRVHTLLPAHLKVRLCPLSSGLQVNRSCRPVAACATAR